MTSVAIIIIKDFLISHFKVKCQARRYENFRTLKRFNLIITIYRMIRLFNFYVTEHVIIVIIGCDQASVVSVAKPIYAYCARRSIARNDDI